MKNSSPVTRLKLEVGGIKFDLTPFTLTPFTLAVTPFTDPIYSLITCPKFNITCCYFEH
jgi:hypothetical protein